MIKGACEKDTKNRVMINRAHAKAAKANSKSLQKVLNGFGRDHRLAAPCHSPWSEASSHTGPQTSPQSSPCVRLKLERMRKRLVVVGCYWKRRSSGSSSRRRRRRHR